MQKITLGLGMIFLSFVPLFFVLLNPAISVLLFFGLMLIGISMYWTSALQAQTPTERSALLHALAFREG